MRDFDKHRAEFDRDFARASQRMKLVAWIAIPICALFILLALGLLSVALYGLARWVGLV